MPFIPGLATAGASEETELYPLEQVAGTRKLTLAVLRLRALALAALGSSGALSGSDLVMVNQSGVPVKLTLDTMAAYITAGAGTGDLLAANNLSDLDSIPTARTNLGLGGAALLNVGTGAGTVAAGDAAPNAHVLDGGLHTITGKTAGQILLATAANAFAFVTMGGDGTISGAGVLSLADVIAAAGPIGSATTVPVITFDAKGRLTAVTTATITAAGLGALLAANNLSDLVDPAAARTNLGLGSAATQSAAAFDAAGSAAAAQAAAAIDATTKANAAQAASQPLDADLTAIADLVTQPYGRSLLTAATAQAAGIQTSGTATIDFGATPATEASIAVTGQTTITSTASIEAWIMARSTVDNTTDNHRQAAAFVRLVCSEATNGVGFTITAYCLQGAFTGTLKINWAWS